MLDQNKKPFQIFICYAREDRAALESLLGHTAVFERSGLAKIWCDLEITGGKKWDEEIRLNLKAADIVLLLISPDFFRSDYIHSVELEEALQRDKNKEALVVPIILKKCLWNKDNRISSLQVLPEEARPVYDKTYWNDPDDAFYDIANGIDRILEDPETERRRYAKEYQNKVKALEEWFDSYGHFGNLCFSGECTIQKGFESGGSTKLFTLLILGKEPGGIPIFAYIAVREDKTAKLIEASKNSPFYPEEQGVLIECGVNRPSPAIIKTMEEEYGFDHNNMQLLA